MGEKTTRSDADELTPQEAPVKWVLSVHDLPHAGISGEKQATGKELRLLTDMLNDEHDLEVKSLRCTYIIKPKKIVAKEGVEGCEGHFELRADLRQTCVVTLERIDTLVQEEFSQDFISAGAYRFKLPAHLDDPDDPFADEPPISLVKSRIELGPLVYQYFSMAIDSNPRKSGVNFEETSSDGEDVDEKPPSPFLALKQYKPKK